MLHPWHAAIAQAQPQDWILEGDHVGRLNTGLVLDFTATSRWGIYAQLEHSGLVILASLPLDAFSPSLCFVERVERFKSILQYPKISRIHHVLLRYLIAQGAQGAWTLSLQDEIRLKSVLDHEEWPVPARLQACLQTLRALPLIASFHPQDPTCYPGVMALHLPPSHHERLLVCQAF